MPRTGFEIAVIGLDDDRDKAVRYIDRDGILCYLSIRGDKLLEAVEQLLSRDLE
jgi:hypothetical protein